MAQAGPPAYAWDWFARQRLLWREVRSRLCGTAAPVAIRYQAVDARADVVALLRADYPRDPAVRDVVHAVVGELAFLGRTDASFSTLGLASAPRGLRWWWMALTGEDPDAVPGPPRPPLATRPPPPAQLTLDDVQQGYGG